MKRKVRDQRAAGIEDRSDVNESILRSYVDHVAHELATLSAEDEEIVIPLSGAEAISIAAYEERFAAQPVCYTRSTTMAIPWPTPIHIVHKAYRPCRRRSS